MKKYCKIFLTIFALIFLAVPAKAIVTFNVVVLPVDLFKVCANYYCYPEVSEIIANDVIENFNGTGRINSPSVTYVRKIMAGNEPLRQKTFKALNDYANGQKLDLPEIKEISKAFNAKSVLLISNDVPVDNEIARRNVWEMLVLSTNFDIAYPYTMETNATLIDTVNDLVMWKGFYTKKISDNNDRFKAPNAADAYAILEYFKMYSKDILSKNISQNIFLRFFPKVIDPMPIVNDTKPEGAYFRFESDANIPALQNQLIQHERKKYSDTESENEEHFGETLYSD